MNANMKEIQNILLQNLRGNHENKNRNGVDTQSQMKSILSQLKSTNIESHNHNQDFLIQDPHHHGFKSTTRNYYIPMINMRKFDGNDSIT